MGCFNKLFKKLFKKNRCDICHKRKRYETYIYCFKCTTIIYLKENEKKLLAIAESIQGCLLIIQQMKRYIDQDMVQLNKVYTIRNIDL